MAYYQYQRILTASFHIIFLLVVNSIRAQRIGDVQLMYEWASLDFDWPSQEHRLAAIADGSFVPERNIPMTVRVFQGDVFISIPRVNWNSGQPATLTKIVQLADGPSKLQPYPDWQSQKMGDCKSFQFVASMAIDPGTKYMYVIDTGRTGIFGSVEPGNLCPAKIVVIDLNSNTIVDIHELSENVVSRSRNFVNDIVLDYVDNKVRYAYISDTSEGQLYAYDFLSRSTTSINHQTMKAEIGNGSVITINGQEYHYPAGINGIAMSSDLKYVYYSPLGGYNLYQIPTNSLRNLFNVDTVGTDDDDYCIRLVGRKVSQSDGIVHGKKQRLYFGALGMSALYYWDIQRDVYVQREPIRRVRMSTQVQLTRNDQTMQWPDSPVFDDGSGWLWFLSSRNQLFKSSKIDFTGVEGSNFRVWRVFVNDTGYLDTGNSIC